MPCYECENGKWKFGQTGNCQYDSKSECETANKDYYAEETYNDYPEAATNNAKRAIKYKEENGSSCGTIVSQSRSRHPTLYHHNLHHMAHLYVVGVF